MTNWEDSEVQEWVREVEEKMVPGMQQSGAVLAMIPKGPTDVKFAVELGMAIMMEKPIIALITPGSPVPSKLVLVADRIIEGDVRDPTTAKRVAEAARETAESDGRANL